MIKKIYTLIISLLLFSSCGNKPSGQTILSDLADQMCDCIELNKYKNAAEIEPCYDELFMNNDKVIKEYYNAKELSESQFYEFGNRVAAKTLERCQYIKKMSIH